MSFFLFVVVLLACLFISFAVLVYFSLIYFDDESEQNIINIEKEEINRKTTKKKN